MLLLSVLFARVSSVENRWRAAGSAVLNTVTGGVSKPTCLFVVADVGQGSCRHIPRASSGPVRRGVCTQVTWEGVTVGYIAYNFGPGFNEEQLGFQQTPQSTASSP